MLVLAVMTEWWDGGVKLTDDRNMIPCYITPLVPWSGTFFTV